MFGSGERMCQAKALRREQRSLAYAELLAGLKDSSTGAANASLLFALLQEAQLTLNSARSSRLAREQFFRESPAAELPAELTDRAIAQYYLEAARLYADAAWANVQRKGWLGAFKHYRKAAGCSRAAAELHGEAANECLQQAKQHRERAAALRQHLAKKSLLRRRLSFGMLRRQH
jgi:hypothetical protein